VVNAGWPVCEFSCRAQCCTAGVYQADLFDLLLVEVVEVALLLLSQVCFCILILEI
jgi:hypothetical protein